MFQINDVYRSYTLDHFCVPKHYEEDLEDIMIPYGLIQDRFGFYILSVGFWHCYYGQKVYFVDLHTYIDWIL